jgi:glycosyltransferase involved in cell wall biosynthesis
LTQTIHAAIESTARASLHTLTFLIYSPYPRYSGGRENWLYNLTGVLSRAGVGVTVISHATNRRPFYPPVAGARLVLLRSVRYFDRPFYWLNRITLGLARLIDTLIIYPWIAARGLAREKPELLICMNSIPEGLAAVLAKQPFMVSVRGDVPAELRPRWLLERPMRSLERWILRRSIHVLANGFDTQARLKENGIESVVVPNGVDPARFRTPGADESAARTMLQAAAGRPVISVVGTLRPIKGTDDAIACARELKQAGGSFLMALVGKGEERRYRRAVTANQVEDVVSVLGETKDVPAILRHTDVFLALSGGSGMSMAVLEAMAAGVAVVALDTPVYRQLITHDVNGVLASPPDVAASCLRLLRDGDLRRRLGQAGARTADGYGWDRVADRLLEEVSARVSREVAV